MDDHRERVRQHALALASAAEKLAEAAGDRSQATYLPTALACVEQALVALRGGVEGAAASLIPPAKADEGI